MIIATKARWGTAKLSWAMTQCKFLSSNIKLAGKAIKVVMLAQGTALRVIGDHMSFGCSQITSLRNLRAKFDKTYRKMNRYRKRHFRMRFHRRR